MPVDKEVSHIVSTQFVARLEALETKTQVHSSAMAAPASLESQPMHVQTTPWIGVYVSLTASSAVTEGQAMELLVNDEYSGDVLTGSIPHDDEILANAVVVGSFGAAAGVGSAPGKQGPDIKNSHSSS